MGDSNREQELHEPTVDELVAGWWRLAGLEPPTTTKPDTE